MNEAEDGVVDALVQASFTVAATLTRIGAEHDLSLTQLRVLAILRDRRLRITALADYLGLEKSTLSGLVDRAEKRGVLRRAPNADDGRAVDVLLTPEGRRLAERGARQVGVALAPLLAHLTQTEQHRLDVLLRKLLGG